MWCESHHDAEWKPSWQSSPLPSSQSDSSPSSTSSSSSSLSSSPSSSSSSSMFSSSSSSSSPSVSSPSCCSLCVLFGTNPYFGCIFLYWLLLLWLEREIAQPDNCCHNDHKQTNKWRNTRSQQTNKKITNKQFLPQDHKQTQDQKQNHKQTNNCFHKITNKQILLLQDHKQTNIVATRSQTIVVTRSQTRWFLFTIFWSISSIYHTFPCRVLWSVGWLVILSPIPSVTLDPYGAFIDHGMSYIFWKVWPTIQKWTDGLRRMTLIPKHQEHTCGAPNYLLDV